MNEPVELTVEECLELLHSGVLGRVALSTPMGPRIVPINYAMDGDDAILFRTTPYSELGTYGWNTDVAFEIDQIDARRFGKLIGEVNLPPVRFAEVGTPSIYLSYLRPAVFAGGMLTHNAEGENHDYETVGAQLDLAFTVALRLPMVFSVGAAQGFIDGHSEKTEFLASLKIM
jgi:hypothetical protein